METKFFNQAAFMARVDECREAKGLRKKEVGEFVGLDGVAYSEWLNGRRNLSVEIAIGICKKVGLRPAWALFDVGPKTDKEAEAIQDIRDVIAGLRAYASLDAARHGHAPLPLSKKQVSEALVNLKDHLPTLLIESKEYAACRSAATILDQLVSLLPEESRGDVQLAVFSEKPASQGGLFPE